METNSIIDTQSQRTLTLTLDALTLLLAGIFAALCSIATQHPFLATSAALAFALTLGLRLWLMKLLGVHTNVSWLNLALKRIAGILVGLIVALFLLPMVCIIALPLVKIKGRGPVFHRIHLSRKGNIVGHGFTFRRNGSLMEDPLLQKIPVLLNLLTGSISLWNLSRTEIIYEDEHIQQTIQPQEG